VRPFGELVVQVMSIAPYASARRVYWVVNNGTLPGAAVVRMCKSPAPVPV